MSHRKPLERRTFSQDRYEILIKRQRSGTATFNELTELDGIINRDPSIRKIVLIYNHFIPDTDEDNESQNEPLANLVKPVKHHSFLNWLRLAIGSIFTSQMSMIKMEY